MFGKYEISLNHVHDKVCVREGTERLILVVEADPMRMVAGINKAKQQFDEITDESDSEQVNNAALAFSNAIFGLEQTERLMDFYHRDGKCVLNVCARYFHDRLAAKITKAQKKIR